MKKFFALLLILVITFAGIIPASALENGIAEFSITPIRSNFKDKYVKVNITTQKKYTNSNILVGFYTQGTLTRLASYDASTATSFKSKQIDTALLIKTSAGNYHLDQTPDQITIFIWDKNRLTPKTICYNALTKEVITAANAEVVETLRQVPEATNFIRENHLISEEDYLDGIVDSWDSYLYKIMDHIDNCAFNAVRDAKNHLITSLYAQNLYKDDLREIRALFNSAPIDQKEKIKNILLNTNDAGVFPPEHKTALDNAMKFLDFTLTEF